jgi:uncharacterized phage protein (predicted DNA packaging)
MEVVSLNLLKDHLRLERDEHEQDELLQSYIDGVVPLVEKHCNTTIDRIIKKHGKVPGDLKIAIMQLAAYWYHNPEAAGSTSLNMHPANAVAVCNKYKRHV